MQPTDDSALLRQYTENHSDEAFAALVARHVNLVYSIALRQVGNPHYAEEITQAVFIILAKKAAGLRHEKALSSWLFQTTRLTASNFIRSETRRHHREEEAHMQSVMDEAGTEVWPRIAPLLDSAVASLREKDRQSIVMRFYEGRNLREVGRALGASEDAAEKRVNRALEKLRRFFTKRGINSTAAILAGAISANSVQAAPAMLAKSVTALAIAKGAAASGSTLTLIKGALRIMAWTKANTVIVIGVVAILAGGTTTMIIKHQNQRVRLPIPQPIASGQTEFPKASWHFAGYANPESDVMTCMWAVGNGDSKTLLASVSPTEQERLRRGNEIITAKDRADYAKMTGYRIIDKQVISEDKVILVVETTRQEQPVKFLVERLGGEWKIAGNLNRNQDDFRYLNKP
jgi:RNA polymerase sigma factor (sigma-70 family)